jgi:hypothetical protein
MKRNEAAFLASVFALALIIAGLSLFRFLELRAMHGETSMAMSSGKPRIVEVEKIRRLIRQGYLSEKEARFYRTSPVATCEQEGLDHPKVPSGSENGDRRTLKIPEESYKGKNSP